MKLIKKTDIPFKNQTYTIEVTGEELVRLHRLSWRAEGGEQFPSKDRDRICYIIQAMFPEIPFEVLGKNLVNGKLP